MSKLPTVEIDGKTYFVDERLKEFRNVENPHDSIKMADRSIIREIDEYGQEKIVHVSKSEEELLKLHKESRCFWDCGYCYEEACASK